MKVCFHLIITFIDLETCNEEGDTCTKTIEENDLMNFNNCNN